MNRVVLAVALLAASFALQHYADKKLEAKNFFSKYFEGIFWRDFS